MRHQKIIDEGYCTQVASGAAPMPNIAFPAAPANQNIYGTITSYGQNGLSTHHYSGFTAPNAGASFASGMAQGAALGASIRAKRAQDAVMKGCMFRLGWVDGK